MYYLCISRYVFGLAYLCHLIYPVASAAPRTFGKLPMPELVLFSMYNVLKCVCEIGKCPVIRVVRGQCVYRSNFWQISISNM